MTAAIYESRPECPARYHGNYGAYQNERCRCPDAREDWRLYCKRRREGRSTIRKVDPTGAIRRIEALMALGHTGAVIGTHAGGVKDREIRRIRSRSLTWITPQTDTAIRAAFESLSGTVGASNITRRRAERRGYAPPLAWDDDTIDDPNANPNVDGDQPDATVVDDIAIERAAAGEIPFGALAKVEQIELFRRYGGTASRTTLARRWGVSGDRMKTLAARAGVAA